MKNFKSCHEDNIDKKLISDILDYLDCEKEFEDFKDNPSKDHIYYKIMHVKFNGLVADTLLAKAGRGEL